ITRPAGTLSSPATTIRLTFVSSRRRSRARVSSSSAWTCPRHGLLCGAGSQRVTHFRGSPRGCIADFLLIIPLDAYSPLVVYRAHDVLAGAHRRVHGVVLVVVLVHAIPADRVEIADVCKEPLPDETQRSFVGLVVDRVRHGHAANVSNLNDGLVTEPELPQLALR